MTSLAEPDSEFKSDILLPKVTGHKLKFLKFK